jgi:hypothetical protein
VELLILPWRGTEGRAENPDGEKKTVLLTVEPHIFNILGSCFSVFMRLAFIFILSLLSLQALFLLQAQPNKLGVPMITNYPNNETGGSEQSRCITQDHRGVIYVGNYDKGIQEYDGVEWRNIAMPKGVPVLSLVCGDDGVVYVGAEGDFGLLEADLMGELHFRSLCDSVLVEKKDRPIIVWKTYAFEKKIWFCTHDGIYIFKPTTGDIELIQTPENAYHSYIADGRLYTKRLTMKNLSLEGVIEEQGVALEEVLLDWMGEISQIDDILVMGLRINPQ